MFNKNELVVVDASLINKKVKHNSYRDEALNLNLESRKVLKTIERKLIKICKKFTKNYKNGDCKLILLLINMTSKGIEGNYKIGIFFSEYLNSNNLIENFDNELSLIKPNVEELILNLYKQIIALIS